MPSVISGDANVSATEFGYLDGVTSALQSQIDSKLNLAGGKILQVVRATDSTARTTTSLTYVDSNLSVTITPQKSTSAIVLIALVLARAAGGTFNGIELAISDNSNNVLSGAEEMLSYSGGSNTGVQPTTVIGYSTPATTSATTYKLRYRVHLSGGTTAEISNDDNTGQLYALEISA